uniref:Transcription factor MafK n=1 Tax=Aceria tosichella TaxID=561515 RepID=A0A6G1SC18_9ACAR
MANSTMVMQHHDSFAMNPLDDPIVRSTLKRIQMTGKDLINATVKDLNKRLVGCSNMAINRLKKCRRTLKNRGYAKNCRIKRLCMRNELELTNVKLRAEINELRLRNKLLQNQVNDLMQRFQPIAQRELANNNNTCQLKLPPDQDTSSTGIGQESHNFRNSNDNNQQEFPVHHHQYHHQEQLEQHQQQQHGQHLQTQYYGYGAPSNYTHEEEEGSQVVQRIHQTIYLDNSCNDSPVSSSSSSSVCFTTDYGPFDGDLEFSNCVSETNYHDQGSCDTSNWGAQVQPNPCQQPKQIISNHVEFY